MLGLKFGGIHSMFYGLIIKSDNRSMLPQLRKRQTDIPNRHGSYDFGGNTYVNRIITVTLTHIGGTVAGMRTANRNTATWLSSNDYKQLIFDDEPELYYLARVFQQVSATSQNTIAESVVTFECLPFAFSTDTDSESKAITGADSITIDYNGTAILGLGSPQQSQFDISIDGSFTDIEITCAGVTIGYTEAITSSELIIDNVNATIELDDVNALADASGDTGTFFSLENGQNVFDITGTALNCTVTITYREQYL